MGRSRYTFLDDRWPHFLTCSVVKWLPLFNRPETAQIVLDSFDFLQNSNRITLFGYVILENHLHFIASAKNPSKEVANFKSFTAKQILQYLQENHAVDTLKQLYFFKLKHKKDRDFQLWQEGSHPEIIPNKKVLIQKLEYIHNNPVERGYVDRPLDWRYSSARNYFGKGGLIEVCKNWM